MATAPHEPIERRQTAPPSASPLDRHAPPTTGTERRSGRAIGALIVGIISVPTALVPIVGLILGVVAVVLGATARSDIRRNRLHGDGQAKAAVILGAIGIVLSLALWIIGAIAVSS
jgi:uncharacterized protein DUF4190